MLVQQQQLLLLHQSQPIHRVPKRSPSTQTTIGKNVFTKRLLQQYVLRRQTRQFLGKYFLRFEKIDDTNVKIGVEDDIKTTEEFVATFVQCLVESHMSGYVFIGLKVPLFKEMVKVEYTQLKRLELVKCNINNIEPLTWLNSTRFSSIYLTKNQITTINSIGKTNFPNFTSISFDQNFITDFRPLTRTRMTPYRPELPNKPELNNKFYLHASLESVHSRDLTFVFRVQNKGICIVGEKAKVDGIMIQPKVLDRILRMEQKPQTQRLQLQ